MKEGKLVKDEFFKTSAFFFFFPSEQIMEITQHRL